MGARFILLGLLPWLIAIAITRKTMRVTLPVCMKHRKHWLNRRLYVLLGLLFWIVYAVALGFEWKDLPQDAASVAMGILFFGGLIWLISGVVYVSTAIKPSLITDRYMELVKVNKEFAREWEEEEPEPKPKKKRRREYDDEEDDE